MASFTEADWRKVLELAHITADLNPAERLAYLRSATSSQSQLEKVLELIEEFDTPGTYHTSSEAEAWPDPLQIGRFEVTGVIGEGGMGKVYAARDPELHRTVAIKLLVQLTGQHARTSADRAIREARLASALSHPNIATVHEVTRQENGSVAIEPLQRRGWRDAPVGRHGRGLRQNAVHLLDR